MRQPNCQQRIENNEERDQINTEWKKEKERNFVAAAVGQMSPDRGQFKPVNSKSPPRHKWLAKTATISSIGFRPGTSFKMPPLPVCQTAR